MINRIRSRIKSYFGFSRTETNAFLILLPLMVVLLFSEPVYRWWFIRHPACEAQGNIKLDSLVSTWQWDKPADTAVLSSSRPFAFDPNTASQEDLSNLGISEILVKRIVNYRTKGGKFRIKSDLSRIYGMDSTSFLRLYPFINLPDKRTLSTITPPPIRSNRAIAAEPFDLNTADTVQLIRIYGIGPKLSMRITAYRDRLGGFISMDQLSEVYGLDSTVINTIKKRSFISADFQPRMININEADQKKLSSLPYIKFNLAKSITAYRFQHGEFKSVDELKGLALMDSSIFKKIKPYLTVKD